MNAEVSGNDDRGQYNRQNLESESYQLHYIKYVLTSAMLDVTSQRPSTPPCSVQAEYSACL